MEWSSYTSTIARSDYLQLHYITLGLFHRVAPFPLLYSNVEESEACSEQEVVITCSGEETNHLEWRSDMFQPQEPVTFSAILGDSVGTVVYRTMSTFRANLTQTDATPTTLGRMTSTLTVTATASLNGTSVECVTLEGSDTLVLRVLSGT